MTNYENVWGNTVHQWRPIDYKGTYILNILIVSAWVGMVVFFLSSLFLLVTQSDASLYFMLVSLIVWLGCGIAAIRIRRVRRKFIVVAHDPIQRRAA